MSGSALLLRFVIEIVGRSSVALTAQSTLHSLYCSAAEHDEIIEAVCGSDRNKAQECMCRHLRSFAERARRIPGRVKEFAELSENAFEHPSKEG